MTENIGWADPDQVDYYNYLARRDSALGPAFAYDDESSRLSFEETKALFMELRRKAKITPKLLQRRRKICEQLFFSAEMAVMFCKE